MQPDTAQPSLLAVVGGQGAASGSDAMPRTIGAGYGVEWSAGESRCVTTDDGLTGVLVSGAFDLWAMSVTQAIVVVDYDPEWPAWFERVREQVWPAVSDVALRIDHVGSTAVAGLAAKPIVDVDVVVAATASVAPAIERLAGIGYRWRGDLGVPGRESFKLLHPIANLPEHHLYVVVEDNTAHVDHWLFRDELRTDAAAREEYAALKRRNAGDGLDRPDLGGADGAR